MPKPLNGNGRYMPGLDGLRALAVFAVIAYHLNVGWAPGGLLGVGVFFVLSGYLITDILVNQWKTNGQIDWKDFWIRRIRRLMPALLVMMAAVMIWIALFDRSQLLVLRGEVLSALLYVNNWWRIYHEVSYFSSFGPPSPFGHLWSLAVEEQFYLLWPLFLVVGFRLAPRRWQLLGLTLALALVSALAMALMYEPGTDPSRVYYGTDTRAFALLIGAALAMVWPSRKLSVKAGPHARLVLDCIGWAALAAIVIMIGLTDQYDSFLYRGGFVLLAVATALTVAVLAHPVSRLGKALGCKPLRWLGVRSYGIYLWHYPVIVLTSPVNPNEQPGLVLPFVQLAASIVLAALSYKFVEEPIRSGKWKLRKRQFRHGVKSHSFHYKRFSVLLSVGLILFICMSCMQGANDHPEVVTETNASIKPEASDETTEPISESSSVDNKLTADSYEWITAIGDSVILGVKPQLKEFLPGIVIDGKVGRQMSDALEDTKQLESDRKLGKVVIIELGTNGPFSSKTLNGLLDSLGDERQIMLVNTRVPRKWQDTVNEMLAQAAEDRANVTLIDWYSYSADKADWFARDGVHLKTEGAEAYVSLIADSIESISMNTSEQRPENKLFSCLARLA